MHHAVTITREKGSTGVLQVDTRVLVLGKRMSCYVELQVIGQTMTPSNLIASATIRLVRELQSLN